MKRVYLCASALAVVLMCAVSAPVSAEGVWNNFNNGRTSFELGAKGGVIISGLKGDGVDVLDDQLRMTVPVVSDDPYVWFIAGATVTFGFGPYFAVQPELLYHRGGKEYSLRQAANIFNLDIRSDYLTIPVLLKLVLPSNHKFRPHFFAGPHLSFTLNSEVDGLSEIPDTLDLAFLDELGRDDDVDDETRNVDVGVTVGVGLDIKVGPGYVVIDARYMRGFIDVFDTDEVTNNAEEIKNQNFAVMAGYTYPF